MKKYIVLLMTILIVLSVSFLFIQKDKFSSEHTLIHAFQYSKADILQSSMNGWAKVNSHFLLSSELEWEVQNIVARLGLFDPHSASKQSHAGDNRNIVTFSGRDPEGYFISIKMESLKRDPAAAGETYLVIDMTRDNSYDSLEDKREEINKAFSRYRVKPKVNLCLIGTYAGEMDIDEMNRLGKGVLNSTKAVKVEGIKENNLASVTAYSPMIQESIRVKDRNVNMNLAMRYNSHENKTYLWLATPVISVEY